MATITPVGITSTEVIGYVQIGGLVILDIQEGDVLVYRDKHYPIRAVEEWTWRPSLTPSFARLERITVSILRAPALSGGRRGTPVLHIPEVSCLAFQPMTAELAGRMALDTPHELLVTFVDGDIYLLLVLEDLKR
jgi:hypothetical protein